MYAIAQSHLYHMMSKRLLCVQKIFTDPFYGCTRRSTHLLILLAHMSAYVAQALHTSANSTFDVRYHLSTKITRHGNRWPTLKRMRQIQELEQVFQHVGHGALHDFPWLADWSSPFKDNTSVAGHLHPQGAKEMVQLGRLFNQRYLAGVTQHNLSHYLDVHATWKARTQQSAEAFLRGLCSTGQHDPKRTSCTPLLKLVSAPSWPIHVQPKYHDPVLRFFEICPAYDAYVKEVRHSFLDAWEDEQRALHIPRLAEALQLKERHLTGRHVNAMWHLCQQEASLWNITDRACALFPPQVHQLISPSRDIPLSLSYTVASLQDALHMEWVEDVQLFVRKGAANPAAYNMAAPLLADILQTLQAAATRDDERHVHAKLSFAHAETLIPLACLLGIFDSQGNVSPQTNPTPPHAVQPTCIGALSHPGQHNTQQLARRVHEDTVDRQGSSSDEDTCSSSFDSSIAGSVSSHTSSSSSSVGSNPDAAAEYDAQRRHEHRADPDSKSGHAWQPPFAPPPSGREWYGSLVAPYGSNIQFVLYKHPESSLNQGSASSGLLLDILYNDVPVKLPGCNTEEGATCTLDAFKEQVLKFGDLGALFQAACS